MLSRVAANLHWMARYIERSDNLARFLLVNLRLQYGHQDSLAAQWEPLIQTTGDQERFAARQGQVQGQSQTMTIPTADRESVVDFLAFDRDYANSILSCLDRARENARTVREAISRPMWQQLNETWLAVRAAAANRPPPERQVAWLEELLGMLTLYQGQVWTNMSRGEGWWFLRLGEMLERSDKTSRILDVKYFTLSPRVEGDTTIDHLHWSSLLRSTDALISYRQRYRQVSPRSVAEFLIFDPALPRSLAYCAHWAEEYLTALLGRSPRPPPVQRLLGMHVARLRYGDIDTVIADGLHEYIDRHQGELNAIGDALRDRFFA